MVIVCASCSFLCRGFYGFYGILLLKYNKVYDHCSVYGIRSTLSDLLIYVKSFFNLICHYAIYDRLISLICVTFSDLYWQCKSRNSYRIRPFLIQLIIVTQSKPENKS